MNINDENEIKKEFQLERVILFSDGVLAIIITIMVLDVKLPDGLRHADPKEAKNAFFQLIAQTYSAYVSAFLLVGKFWMTHLRIFSFLKDYDSKLLAYQPAYFYSAYRFSLLQLSFCFQECGPQVMQYTWGRLYLRRHYLFHHFYANAAGRLPDQKQRINCV